MQVLCTMNIRAPKGTPVKVIHENGEVRNGTDADKCLVYVHLALNSLYHVDYTIVGDWRTTVYLEECPVVGFNSVNFKEV